MTDKKNLKKMKAIIDAMQLERNVIWKKFFNNSDKSLENRAKYIEEDAKIQEKYEPIFKRSGF